MNGHPSSFPRTRESSTGRDAGAYDLVAAGVPARHFLDPGSESVVTDSFPQIGQKFWQLLRPSFQCNVLEYRDNLFRIEPLRIIGIYKRFSNLTVCTYDIGGGDR